MELCAINDRRCIKNYGKNPTLQFFSAKAGGPTGSSANFSCKHHESGSSKPQKTTSK